MILQRLPRRWWTPLAGLVMAACAPAATLRADPRAPAGASGPRTDAIVASPDWQVSAHETVTHQRDGRFPSDHFPVVARLVLAPPPTGAALGIEALGGALGSVVGLGISQTLPHSDCGENLGCTLGRASGAVLLATAGSALAAYGAGQLLHTEPSGWGALIGAAAGALAGIGVVHLVTEEAGVNASDGVRIMLFGVTQGALTGIGSRLGAALR